MHRSISVLPVATLFLCATLALPSELRANPLLGKVARWGLGQMVSYGVSKAVDLATGQDFHQQLEREIPRLVARIASTIGPQRAVLQENLQLHRTG